MKAALIHEAGQECENVLISVEIVSKCGFPVCRIFAWTYGSFIEIKSIYIKTSKSSKSNKQLKIRLSDVQRDKFRLRGTDGTGLSS